VVNRSGGVIALTVVGVLVAGGTAGAVNTRILSTGAATAVGSAESLLPAGEPSAGTTSPVATPSPVASVTLTAESPSTPVAPSSASRTSTNPRRTTSSTSPTGPDPPVTGAHAESPTASVPRPTPTGDHGGSNGSGWNGPGSNGPGSTGPGSTGSGWNGSGSNGPISGPAGGRDD